jgi:hypothetical protein
VITARPSYPGNYGEGISGGPPSITGAATSIAAFVGWAAKGPANRAVLVQSWMAFESLFGGLSSNNGLPDYLGYAVSQFFANGGQSAYILRIVWDGSLSWAGLPSTARPACVASATGVGSTFTLYASSPGSWGNNVWVKVITEPSPSTTFTVQLLDGSGELLEDFANLSVSPADPRYVVGVDHQRIQQCDVRKTSAAAAGRDPSSRSTQRYAHRGREPGRGP